MSAFPRDLPPSMDNLLGTDSRGIDIFWTATFAVRNSLTIAIIAGLISRLITVPVGMIAGYSGGMTDRVLMFISDTFFGHTLVFNYCFTSYADSRCYEFGDDWAFIGPFWLAWDARVVRSEILSLRERGFTKTAVLSGTGTYVLCLMNICLCDSVGICHTD